MEIFFCRKSPIERFVKNRGGMVVPCSTVLRKEQACLQIVLNPKDALVDVLIIDLKDNCGTRNNC